MTDLTQPTVDTTPNPTLTSLLFSLLRAGLVAGSTLGIWHGASVPDGTLMMLASALVALGSAAWGIWDKVQAARKVHDSAMLSAEASRVASRMAGAPVGVAVQPK